MLRKVKLKLTQPNIKCSGRGNVTCHYRGKVLAEVSLDRLISFKVNGEQVEAWYYDHSGFREPSLLDIKIVSR